MELSEKFDSSTYPGWINVVSMAKIDMAMNKTHSASRYQATSGAMQLKAH